MSNEIEIPNIEEVNPGLEPIQTAGIPIISSSNAKNGDVSGTDIGSRITNTQMKLGVGYNVFDGEELLESSIRSIRHMVDYIVVVYQLISNFGEQCSPELVPLLQRLKNDGLVDELVEYQSRPFKPNEKLQVSSPYSNQIPHGKPEIIGDQFINELTKREIGRQKCIDQSCTHFMTMDTDEYYLEEQFRRAKEDILRNDYEGTFCKMRYYFKSARYELMPLEEVNYVPFIYKIKPESRFYLAHPYPILCDPTRVIKEIGLIKVYERCELEMHHMSFIRRDIRKKILNTSNRGNYGGGKMEEVLQFIREFQHWTPELPLIHPHPHFKNSFTRVEQRANVFNVPEF